MPMIEIDAFASFAELEANHPERYFHYFADMRIVLAHMGFFQSMRHKTIVLANSAVDKASALGSFHTIVPTSPRSNCFAPSLCSNSMPTPMVVICRP